MALINNQEQSKPKTKLGQFLGQFPANLFGKRENKAPISSVGTNKQTTPQQAKIPLNPTTKSKPINKPVVKYTATPTPATPTPAKPPSTSELSTQSNQDINNQKEILENTQNPYNQDISNAQSEINKINDEFKSFQDEKATNLRKISTSGGLNPFVSGQGAAYQNEALQKESSITNRLKAATDVLNSATTRRDQLVSSASDVSKNRQGLLSTSLPRTKQPVETVYDPVSGQGLNNQSTDVLRGQNVSDLSKFQGQKNEINNSINQINSVSQQVNSLLQKGSVNTTISPWLNKKIKDIQGQVGTPELQGTIQVLNNAITDIKSLTTQAIAVAGDQSITDNLRKQISSVVNGDATPETIKVVLDGLSHLINARSKSLDGQINNLSKNVDNPPSTSSSIYNNVNKTLKSGGTVGWGSQ